MRIHIPKKSPKIEFPPVRLFKEDLLELENIFLLFKNTENNFFVSINEDILLDNIGELNELANVKIRLMGIGITSPFVYLAMSPGGCTLGFENSEDDKQTY